MKEIYSVENKLEVNKLQMEKKAIFYDQMEF
jgi:hypothetical protein